MLGFPVKRQRSASFGIVSWAVLLLVAGAQVAAQCHLIFERHGICAEHGELVDLDPAQTPAPAPEYASESLAAVHPPQPDHHCAIATALLRAARHAAVDHSPIAGASVAREDLRPFAIIPLQIAILSLAPKHSPPLT
jgi:hypothetical protein